MNRSHLLISGLIFAASASAQTGSPVWSTYARESTHHGVAPAPTQSLQQILWHTPVDRAPQYQPGGELLIHYGSPLITHNNVIVVPVKTGATDGWVCEGRNATTGALIYRQSTDYSIPNYPNLGWTPTFSPALSPDGRLYLPAAGGTVLRRDNPESATSTYTRLMFINPSVYVADRANYNANVKICTPITVDAQGNLYFGFITFGTNIDRTPIGAAKVISGFAKITAAGIGTWRSCTSIAYDTTATHVEFNCGPVVSPDGLTVYTVIKKSAGGGYLVGLSTSNLGLKYYRRLLDPSTANEAILTDQSSAAPMVGPDGDVYMGVLSNPHVQHNGRGFMLHFDKTLATQYAPGSFGWDCTPSVIPSSAVPSYAGLSTYLLVTKYNNYAGFGTGDGTNKVGLLDPKATETDFISGIPVMREVQTALGVTPDADAIGAGFPNAVREWCINSAVVDPFTDSAIVNSEDGHVYRWDFVTQTLSENVLLNGPIGEAYTPTISGPTGIVYAINNATLYAVGNVAGTKAPQAQASNQK